MEWDCLYYRLCATVIISLSHYKSMFCLHSLLHLKVVGKWAKNINYFSALLLKNSSITNIKFWHAKIFILVMWSGTYLARAAQAGIRLPPTIEAVKPDHNFLHIWMRTKPRFLDRVFSYCMSIFWKLFFNE